MYATNTPGTERDAPRLWRYPGPKSKKQNASSPPFQTILHQLEQCAIWLSHYLYGERDLIVGGCLTTAVHTTERNAEVAQPF
jgi:hypothetical protein